MSTRYNLAQMLAEIREDTGEPARSAHLTQDEIKAMLRRKREAAAQTAAEAAAVEVSHAAQ